MRVRFWLTALAVALGTCAQADILALTGGMVVPGPGEAPVEATVIADGGRIVSVTPGLAPPPNAKVVDAKGLYIYPGFVNGYVSDFLKLPDAPAAGTPPDTSTQAPPTMWDKNRKSDRAEVRADECVQWADLLRLHSAGFTSALIAPDGGNFRGTAAMAIVSDAKAFVAKSAGMAMSIRSAGGGPGGGGGGGGRGGYPGSLLGFIALMRQTLIDAGQAPADTKDPVLLALKPLLSGGVPAIFYANTDIEILRSIRLADEFQLRPIIAGGQDAYKVADVLAARSIPVLAGIDIGSAPDVKPEPDGPPAPVLQERADQWAERADNLKKLLEAKVPVLLSSQGGAPTSFLDNVRKQLARGVSASDMLTVLTAGSLVGGSDSRVKVGSQANLTILTGDLADARTKVRMVVADGKLFELKEAGK